MGNFPDVGDDQALLPTLVKIFNEEGRRELFEAVLRPRVTEIQLICSASSSSAAFPRGEAFRFEFSPKGTHLLALSSSRIFVVNLAQPSVKVDRELKISKRPVCAAILDDGSILAVLSANNNVTLYNLTGPAKIIRSFTLENEPRTIALSPGAEVLGAAFDGGIEVYSLHPSAGPTDRRAVNCDPVDSLAFSPDGTILLGTTLNTKTPTTVIVSAQHFSTDMPVEGLAALWTTQVLFPRSSRDSSHASLLPGEEDEEGATWTFTYDRTYDTFRAVRVDDLRNGHTYFAGPHDEERGIPTPPATLPASTKDGSLVAAGFSGGHIWIYGIPGKLDLPADFSDSTSVASTPERSNSSASRSVRRSLAVPQWQLLCDKVRNVFIRGREIGFVPGLSAVKFVATGGYERLVAVAGGGVDEPQVCVEDYGDEYFAIGGGRVMVYDFFRLPQVPEKTTITIEIGDGIQGQVETLQEELRDIEVEVDLARRRTVALRRNAGARTAPMGPHEASNITIGESPRESRNQESRTFQTPNQLLLPRQTPHRAATQRSPVTSRPPQPPSPEISDEEADEPYIQGAPRSRTALQRAATVARAVPRAGDVNRYARAVGPDGRPYQRPQPVPAPGQQGPPRPGGPPGQPQRPEERWEPPPPPYTPRSENPAPLPPQLLWSLQGPPRFPEVHGEQGQTAAPAQGQTLGVESRLEGSRSTLGNVMRRGSIFRLAVGGSRSAPGSAPVSPHPGVGTSALGLPNLRGSQRQSRRGSDSDMTAASAAVQAVTAAPERGRQGPHVSQPSVGTLQPQLHNAPPIPPIPREVREHYAPNPPTLISVNSAPPTLPALMAPGPLSLMVPCRSPPTRRPSPSPARRPSQIRGASRPTTPHTANPTSPIPQLQPPPIPGSATRGVSPRNSVIVRRNGSLVVRRPSRAGRSARVNVVQAAAGRRAEGKAKKDKGCVIM
jgi:hypothetical protein